MSDDNVHPAILRERIKELEPALLRQAELSVRLYRCEMALDATEHVLKQSLGIIQQLKEDLQYESN